MRTFHHQKPLPPISFLPVRVKGVFLCETFLDPPKLGRVPSSSPPPPALSALDCLTCVLIMWSTTFTALTQTSDA